MKNAIEIDENFDVFGFKPLIYHGTKDYFIDLFFNLVKKIDKYKNEIIIFGLILVNIESITKSNFSKNFTFNFKNIFSIKYLPNLIKNITTVILFVLFFQNIFNIIKDSKYKIKIKVFKRRINKKNHLRYFEKTLNTIIKRHGIKNAKTTYLFVAFVNIFIMTKLFNNKKSKK